MKIDLTRTYDRDDALLDAETWSDVKAAIDVVLAANASLESTGTLDYMPGIFDHTNLELTPERRREEYDYKTAAIDRAVAKIKSILPPSNDDAPTPKKSPLPKNQPPMTSASASTATTKSN